MKKYPKNLGIWIWNISQCDNGDWNKIISKCKSAGIGWIAIKSGDAYRNKQLSSSNLKKILDICHKNDILVYSWNYSKPLSWREEIVQIKSLFDDGIDGHIIDAESEWQIEHKNKPIAEEFLSTLRKTVGNDVFIAHAPFPIVDYHIIFPYIEFGKYCDAIMPQSYWTEIGWTLEKTLDKTDAAWEKFNSQHPESTKPVYPVGVTYGKGYPNVPGLLKKEDIISFVKRYPDLPISFYSYDASKNFQFVWMTLNELEAAKKPKIEPQPIYIELPPKEIFIDQAADKPLPIPKTMIQNIFDFFSSFLSKK